MPFAISKDGHSYIFSKIFFPFDIIQIIVNIDVLYEDS
jgi:hypothetical protein